MMKKISKAFILALCAIFMVGVASCDSDNNGSTGGGGDDKPVSGKHYLCITYQFEGDFNDLAEAEIKYSITPGDTVVIPAATVALSHQQVVEVKNFPTKLYADVKVTPKASYPTKDKYNLICLVAAGYGIPSTEGPSALAGYTMFSAENQGIRGAAIDAFLKSISKRNVPFCVEVDAKGNAIR